ncbi:hypothetical protein NH26_24055 [Flammeovirga pacifica]|uniref:histidine kinase n=2 Tax=Flammeovirga pacifica TaxID=915059 RepID=A0A1S1YUE5_FLAPC|nr:hypothetical protein NH26_24055 [Flammeovirga pacifica]
MTSLTLRATRKFIHTLLIALFIFQYSFAQNNHINIDQLELNSTNGSSNINCIVQSKKGYLLIGTNNGLLKYNGHDVTFLHTDINVRQLIEDKKGNLWIGTIDGLFFLDHQTKKTSFFEKTGVESIRSLYLSKFGELLIGTEKGLVIYNLQTRDFSKYIHHQNIDEGISSNTIRSIYEDDDNNLWIGTADKLNKFDRKNNTFIHFDLRPNDIPTPKNNLILAIKEVIHNHKKLLLIGTETGLCIFNKENETWTTHTSVSSKGSLSNDVVKKIIITKNNHIWLGTDYGLNLFDINKNTFSSIFHEFGKINTINGNTIQALCYDNQDNVWIGSQNGINVIYNNSNDITFNKLENNAEPLPGGISINAITEDIKGDYWIGSNMGLIKYDIQKRKYTFFSPPHILHRKVLDVYADKKGTIWITTSGGLNTYDIYKKTFNKYIANPSNKDALQTNYLSKIIGDSNGNIWLGTFDKGLYKVIRKKDQLVFMNFNHETKNPDSLPNNGVFDLKFDENNKLWVSTYSTLATFDPVKGRFITINEFSKSSKTPKFDIVNALLTNKEGLYFVFQDKLYMKHINSEKITLIDSLTKGINSLIVLDQKVWYCDSKNLHYYDIKTKDLFKIPITKTLISNFKEYAYINKNNELFFFGKEGFIKFNPKNVSFNKQSKPIIITDLQVNEKSIPTPLNDITTLDLTYEENNFKISFSTMHLSVSDPTIYKYKLEGYDQKWLTLNNDNTIGYKNLRPKKYVLKLKAANENGVFSEDGKSITINVFPPFWATNWAYGCYFILVIIFLIIIKKVLTQKIHYTNDIKLEKLKREKSEELIEIKTKFYNNITHDLKTPLSLILGPTEQLLANEKDPLKINTLKIIKRNTNKLQSQVNKILDLRKIEKGVEKLRIQQYDIVKFSKRIVEQFKEETLHRAIEITFNSSIPSQKMWFDMEKLEKVFYNLLSNAFKFTPDNGKIALEIQPTDNNFIKVIFTDTGVGIPNDKLELIFDRFNSVENKNFTNQQGSGIGLSIVKQYLSLHSGTIEVASDIQKGTTFSIYLPLSKDALQNYVESEIVIKTDDESTSKSDQINKVEDNGQPIILIIDDDIDMREFLSQSFKSKFRVLLAEDGEEGFNIALKEIPDIIISDVMMPKMNGFDLCKKIKDNVNTAHIPFMLLTAKNSSESKLIGTEYGADDYIEKPFQLNYLLTKSQQLLNQRHKLKKSYVHEVLLEPSEVLVQSEDDKFLVQVMKIIEKNIENSDFNVKMLSNDLNMSHSNFYRKVKGLTGQTATDLIRTVRLKRAAQLLDTNVYRVKDVMYLSGFTHNSYFTRSFKGLYGVTPKEYMLMKKKEVPVS